MELDAMVQIISTVGFPIVCVMGLAWFVYKAYNNLSVSNKEREEKLYTMLGKAQEQLDNAQRTNERFVSVLEDFQRDTDSMRTDIAQIKNDVRMLPKRKNDVVEGESNGKSRVSKRCSTDNSVDSE